MSRVSEFFFVDGASLALLLFAGTYLFGPGEGVWIALGVWVAVAAYLLMFQLVTVPPVTRVMLLDLLRKDDRGEGRITFCPPGWRLKSLFEQIDRTIDMDLKTNTFHEKTSGGALVDGFSFPAKDGPIVHVTGSYQWRPDPDRLHRLIMVNKNTINEGIMDIVSGFLSSVIAHKKAVDARGKIHEISKAVDDYFSTEKNGTDLEKEGTEKRRTLEERYGIIIEMVAVADIDYEERYQAARATQQVMETLRKTASDSMRERKKDGDAIRYGDAMNNVLAVHPKARVSKHVQGVEGDGAEAFTSMLKAIFGNRQDSDSDNKGDI